jgi:mono/diheme cytochrome c family protein
VNLIPTVPIIQLPVEVTSVNGVVKVPFFVPTRLNLVGPLVLSLQTHGLKFETEASVQVNNGVWSPINTSTVTMQGLEAKYGGIGGGYHTLTFTLPLPGSVAVGVNSLNFRFNGTDGLTSEYRVLAFNILANGTPILPASAFTQTDPKTWLPPLNNPTDIAAGKTLYQTAQLNSGMAFLIKAHCMDCHTQDGRDLKYFNYSNNDISARSQFHGLTVNQGLQIASYIRSLSTPSPGRPWNPLYQPGPGLDSQPVANWSAGAGIIAVLPDDATLLSNLIPSGPNSPVFSPNAVTNIRETPIPMQLPDWNAWLPAIHPMDAWPDFQTSAFNSRYSQLRAQLIPGSATAYASAAPTFGIWMSDFQMFEIPKTSVPQPWTAAYIQQVYSISLWAMVKNWELNQEFQLEGMANTVFTNPKAESRAWLSQFPFFSSPNMLHIAPYTLFGNGQHSTWEYFAQVWYQTQLILNNSQYQQNGTTPIDWGYVYGILKDLSGTTSTPQVGLQTLWLGKGSQISNNEIGPEVPGTGWNWVVSDISREVSPSWRNVWTGTPAATRTMLMTGSAQGWLASVKMFTPAQFYAGASGVTPTQTPAQGQPDSRWIDRVWFMIPQFRYYGVSQTLITQMAAWAQSIWPAANWTATTTATCVEDSSGTFARCSTE